MSNNKKNVSKERIIDLCGSILDLDGSIKENTQWYGRAFINKAGQFIGVADDVYSDGHYLVAGRQTKEGLSLIRCMVNGNPNVVVEYNTNRVNDTDTFTGESTLKFYANKHELGACKLLSVPFEKTREYRSEEIYALYGDIVESRSLLSPYQRASYEDFIQTKKKENTQGNIQEVHCVK